MVRGQSMHAPVLGGLAIAFCVYLVICVAGPLPGMAEPTCQCRAGTDAGHAAKPGQWLASWDAAVDKLHDTIGLRTGWRPH